MNYKSSKLCNQTCHHDQPRALTRPARSSTVPLILACLECWLERSCQASLLLYMYDLYSLDVAMTTLTCKFKPWWALNGNKRATTPMASRLLLRVIWGGSRRGTGQELKGATWKVTGDQRFHTTGMITRCREEGGKTDCLECSHASQQREETFSEMFRNSCFVQAVGPVGKTVKGEIIAVVDENLYVDFGCKFHAVVPRPEVKSELSRKGSKVRVRVRDLEVTGHFLGDSRDTSLLEAKVELVGLLDS